MAIHYTEHKHYFKRDFGEFRADGRASGTTTQYDYAAIKQSIEAWTENPSNNSFNEPWVMTTGGLTFRGTWDHSISSALDCFFSIDAEYSDCVSLDWFVHSKAIIAEHELSNLYEKARLGLEALVNGNEERERLYHRRIQDILVPEQRCSSKFTAHVVLQSLPNTVFIFSTYLNTGGGFDGVFDRDLSFTIEV